MHVLGYDCTLCELLKLNNTIKATIVYLKSLNKLKEILILVTVNYSYGFNIINSINIKYLNAQSIYRKKHFTINTY